MGLRILLLIFGPKILLRDKYLVSGLRFFFSGLTLFLQVASCKVGFIFLYWNGYLYSPDDVLRGDSPVPNDLCEGAGVKASAWWLPVPVGVLYVSRSLTCDCIRVSLS